MEFRGRRVLVCDCEKTMPIRADRLEKACQAAGATGPADLNTQLCRSQLNNFHAALTSGSPLLVACTQEAPLFTEVAFEERPEADLRFTNIRETAGWSEAADGAAATAKMAALLAEATLDILPSPSVAYESEGACLVYGRDEQAIEVGKRLAGRLEVTVLLTGTAEILPPSVMNVPVFRGTIVAAKGHLGGFAITVDGYGPALPSSRGSLDYEPPRNNAYSECDLILDISGEQPLFPAHERRDGYLRPAPGDPVALERALFDIAELVGEFEKPRYIAYDAEICAHSRNRQTGCTRCLDVCPVSAIQPDGDHVAIDPHVCGGCGMCASVCPTGAATYQLPAGDSLYERLRVLLQTYRSAAGGKPPEDPILLLHEDRHGRPLVDLMARTGRGLPGPVIPFQLNEVTQVGLDFLVTAFAYGAAQIAVLVGPEKRDELAGLASQIGLAEAAMEGLGYGGGRIHLFDQLDPDAVEAGLHGLAPRPAPPAGSFLPMGGKRTRTLLALRHLHEQAPQKVELLPLPPGAPFGFARVDAKGCTLCLACVSACPTGAMMDDPERPWLGFNEEACIQCGLCRTTCPESVITLEPRLSFAEAARSPVTQHQQKPFNCIRCGKPFGVRSTVERIAKQLAGKHSMFQGGEQIERLMMCDDCRVVVQFEVTDAPFAAAPRPTPRTTDDYFREREIEEARAKLLQERASGKDGNGEA